MLQLQQKESLEAEKKRLNEERQKREVMRRKQELQEIEKKQAMDKIAALKKTSVGAKALKDLTEEVMDCFVVYCMSVLQVQRIDVSIWWTAHLSLLNLTLTLTYRK